MVLVPILPKEFIFFRFATPVKREKKTMGTTNIFKIFKKRLPPKLNKFNKILIDDGNKFESSFARIPSIIPQKKPAKILFVNLSFIWCPLLVTLQWLSLTKTLFYY